MSSETEGVKYSVNSLPVIDEKTTVNVYLGVPATGNYTLLIKNRMNFEDYEAIDLYDNQSQTTQNLLLKDCYIFNCTAGDNKNRFVLSFKQRTFQTITNLDAASTYAKVDISSNTTNMVSIHTHNTSGNEANVEITTIGGQQVYNQEAMDVTNDTSLINIANMRRGIYIVKASIDGHTYAKEVFLGE